MGKSISNYSNPDEMKEVLDILRRTSNPQTLYVKHPEPFDFMEVPKKLVKDQPDLSSKSFTLYKKPCEIKDVIFNDPATIVFWEDGTKTVVKCQEGDTFDPEKGLAMAIVKKTYGNKSNYCNRIKKWTEKYETQKNDAVGLFEMLSDITDWLNSNLIKPGADSSEPTPLGCQGPCLCYYDDPLPHCPTCLFRADV